MDKTSLRVKYSVKRSEMPIDEVEVKSHAIARNLMHAADWTRIRSMHIYTPLTPLREVDTKYLVSYFEEHFPAVRLKISTAGKNSAIPSESFDLVVVPLLAFDDNLHRLGFGGGWYDRFLATQNTAVKIGLAYEMQHCNELRAEPHDIGLDMVVTEKRVITI